MVDVRSSSGLMPPSTYNFNYLPCGGFTAVPLSLPTALVEALQRGEEGLRLELNRSTIRVVDKRGKEQRFDYQVSGSTAREGTVVKREEGGLRRVHTASGLMFMDMKEEEKRRRLGETNLASVRRVEERKGTNLKSLERVMEKGRMEEKDLKRKHIDTTTPESGYDSSRVGDFEEEKVQDVDELSDETPFKKVKLADETSKSKTNLKYETSFTNSKHSDKIPFNTNVTVDKFQTKTQSQNVRSPKDGFKSKLQTSFKENQIVYNPKKNMMLYPNVDTGFLTKYPPLKRDKDRDAYKAEFDRSYSIYLALRSRLMLRWDEYSKLDESLQGYKSVKELRPERTLNRAKAARQRMEQIVMESNQDKPQYKYLHEKLAHLKRAGAEWDSKQ